MTINYLDEKPFNMSKEDYIDKIINQLLQENAELKQRVKDLEEYEPYDFYEDYTRDIEILEERLERLENK